MEQDTIRSAQSQVRQWIKDHGVRYFDQLTNMAILTEEVGEVARVIARTYGEQSRKDHSEELNLAKELADVLFVTLCLADQCDIDLQDAFEQRLVRKAHRDHERHQGNPKLR